MTNKEDEQNPPYNPRVAALLAMHLVGQVLDEAYAIANAANDSGQPWRYVSSLKKLRSCRFNELYDEGMTFAVSNSDSGYMNDTNIENITNAVVASTPQKDAAEAHKLSKGSALIGQGDEEFEVSINESRKSTSMFINHLFDMSDVEDVIASDATDVLSTNITISEDNDLIEAMRIIMDTCVNFALNIAFEKGQGENSRSIRNELSSVTVNSSYSYLSDAYDISKDINEFLTVKGEIMYTKTIDPKLAESTNEHNLRIENDYENTYLTLNRDYEQYSEQDVNMIQDLMLTPMQEVELTTVNKSAENIAPRQELEKEIGASGISVSNAASRKSNLVRRCRIQGAKLLSCLKGWWWKRKLPGKRRNPRGPSSIRGLCTLSPDARRRTASLLDHRNLRTPSPSKSMVWKFNTINEALVHSSRWKEFNEGSKEVKMSLNENGEF